MIALYLLGRPAQGTGMLLDLTPHARDWRRSSRAQGGFWQGTFNVADLPPQQLQDLFDRAIGCMVRELTFGQVTWEGYVQELRLSLGGREYIRRLSPEVWHNKVAVAYQSVAGAPGTVSWAENASSSDEYGEMGYLVTLGQTSTTVATAVRDRHLVEYAWPRSRFGGGYSFGSAARASEGDSLEFTCAGFWSTLNWRYQTSSLGDTVAVLIAALAGASEFVTAGRVESNSLPANLDCTNPQRLGDLIEQLVGMGDASGNAYQAGVYESRKLVYEPKPTTAAYLLRDGQLYGAAGLPVVPSLVRPGALVKNLDSPFGTQPAGTSSVWDDPRVGYVEEVEFARPSGLTLRFQLADEGIGTRLGWYPGEREGTPGEEYWRREESSLEGGR